MKRVKRNYMTYNIIRLIKVYDILYFIRIKILITSISTQCFFVRKKYK